MAKRRAPNPERLGGKKPAESMFVVLLNALSRNLANILRVALVLGFVAILDPLLNKIDEHMTTRATPASVDVAPSFAESQPPANPEAAISDGASQAIRDSEARLEFVANCTRKDFRNANYDACFPNGSAIYRRPTAEEDEGSLLYLLNEETLYATR